MVALLSSATGKEVAERLGVSVSAALQQRRQRGLPPPATGKHYHLWTPEETALLGTAPDEEVARMLGLSVGGSRPHGSEPEGRRSGVVMTAEQPPKDYPGRCTIKRWGRSGRSRLTAMSWP